MHMHMHMHTHTHTHIHMLAQVGAPLLALLDGEARQRGPTQAEVLAAADPLVRRLLRGVALEAERAALRNGEAHVAHEAAAAATVAAAEGVAAEGAEREPEVAALRKALAAQGEALRRAETAVAEREVAISRLGAEVRQAEAAAQRAQAAVEVQAHEIDRRHDSPAQREASGPLFDKASAPSPRGTLAPPATAPAPAPGNRLDAGASLAWLHSPESSPVTTTTAAASLQASGLETEAAAPVAKRAPPARERSQPYAARISFDTGVAEVSLEEAPVSWRR